MKRLHTGLALLPSKSQVCGSTFKLFPLSWACRFLIMNEYDLSCHLQWPGEVLFEGSAGHQILSERVAWLQFELSRSVLAGFDALAPLTLEALLDGYEATQACTSSQCQSYQGASLSNLSGIPSIWQEQSICKFMDVQ